jgi:hypothetical protein
MSPTVQGFLVPLKTVIGSSLSEWRVICIAESVNRPLQTVQVKGTFIKDEEELHQKVVNLSAA